jgi:hypothetical protein
MQKMHVIHHRESVDAFHGSFGATAMPWYDERAYQTAEMSFRGHGGGTAGFSAFAGFDLTRRRGVIVLSNKLTRSSCIGWRILQGASLKQTDEQTASPILEIVGIGTAVVIDDDTKMMRISGIIPDSPAAHAGIANGLIIQKIDDKHTKGLSMAECMKLLTGPAGSKVRLALINAKSKETQSVELTRQKFLISS